jgi:phosphoribosylformimino-5-aminoimidazole carboxamide ribotide isomerase
MRIIVAVDILGGKCVRLTRGDFDTTRTYNEDPVEVAKMIEAEGIGYLHMVDLDGARNRKVVNLKILERAASETNLKIDFGGGIRSDEDLRNVFSAGAVQITAGSIAVTDRELFLQWLGEYGPEKIILGADYKNNKISVSGWLEDSDADIISFLSTYRSRGVRYTICTDIELDGMLGGPATGMYRKILEKVDINLIASGGISSVEDIRAVREAGCEGVIIGKAFYEGRITLKELVNIC